MKTDNGQQPSKNGQQTTDNGKTAIDAILSGYLERFQPSDTLTSDCILMDTQTIVFELQDMYDLSINEVADYLASMGYRFHYHGPTALFGWILRPRTKVNVE